MLDTRHIIRPVVVGHSLGGTLAISLAEAHPERLAGIIAFDGLPVYPALAQLSAEERAAQGKEIAAQISSETPAQELAGDEQFMQTVGTNDPDLVQSTAILEAKSDPRSVAAWTQADVDADLRPGLFNITIPFLELMPYADPSPYTKDQTVAFYGLLLTGAPTVQVVPIDGARHFAMVDQPREVDAAITHFLADLK